MKMRALGTTGLTVSEIGLGCEHLEGKPYQTVETVIEAALNGGVNILDVFMPNPEVRTHIGQALKKLGQSPILQGHIGAVWQNGQYKRTRDVAQCQAGFEDFEKRLGQPVVDIGMIHFVDSLDDLEATLESGIIEYAQSLKKAGRIRAVGLSSHDPRTAQELIDTGMIDVLMFSINPAFDALPPNVDIDQLFGTAAYEAQDTLGIDPVRAQLYASCAARGVGITVMKALGGGRLLNAAASPLGAPLTVAQCTAYALSRPAVSSVLLGCQTVEEVVKALAVDKASAGELDYAGVLSAMPKAGANGQCLYCNHCLPCPMRIDIASVNKYLDLAIASQGAPTVREHYDALTMHAGDCIACGQCVPRCPFGVSIVGRMQEAVRIFGR